MTAQQMRKQLKAFGLPLDGSQEELVCRLQTALAAAAVHGHAPDALHPDSPPTSMMTGVSGHAQPAAAMAQEVRAEALSHPLLPPWAAPRFSSVLLPVPARP